MNAITDDSGVRAMLRDLIDVEAAPLKDALRSMLGLWLVENSISTATDGPVKAFDLALRQGTVVKMKLPVAVLLALYALDYDWPD